jgi:pimeloyl-[acyl-carrier protein] methyl ester esterase
VDVQADATSRSRFVLIPGWSCGPGVWDRLLVDVGMMSATHVDFRGVRRPADFSAAVMTAMGDEPLFLIGSSMGAMLAIEVASRITGHIRGLVLVGGTPRFISDDPRRGWPTRLFERMKRKMNQDVSATVAGFQAGMFATGEESAADAFRHQRSCHEGWTVDALLAGLDYLIATDLTERLEAVACPVLWIHGGADTICPPGAIAQVPQRHHCHVMPNAGHLPAWTRSHEVASTMRSFFENDA